MQPCFFVQWQAKVSLSDLVHDAFERVGVVHRQICKSLAVEFDAGFFEQVHKSRVRNAMLARRCIDALNPKRAEFAFFQFAADVRVLHTFFDLVFRDGVDVFLSSEIAAGLFQNLFSSSLGSYAVDGTHILSGLQYG